MLFDLIQVANNEDISSGKSIVLKEYYAYSLYIDTAAAIDITIALSPDGTNWYDIPEGDRIYGAAATDIIEFGYVAQGLKITGSNTTNVTAYMLADR